MYRRSPQYSPRTTRATERVHAWKHLDLNYAFQFIATHARICDARYAPKWITRATGDTAVPFPRSGPYNAPRLTWEPRSRARRHQYCTQIGRAMFAQALINLVGSLHGSANSILMSLLLLCA